MFPSVDNYPYISCLIGAPMQFNGCTQQCLQSKSMQFFIITACTTRPYEGYGKYNTAYNLIEDWSIVIR